jgi:hypothetical protein
LASELVDFLASADPELRDEIGYSTLAAWIYQSRILQPDAILALNQRLLDNLKQGIGEQDTDGVFRRSFSALVLSVVVARDNATPFLNAQDLRRIEDSALVYLNAELDVRGYDPVKGWMHSAAHTADLLKFLARSRYLAPSEQNRILDAIVAKLTEAVVVFTHGEDERFARAVLSVVNRLDFDREAFRMWAKARPNRPTSARPTVAELRAFQNMKNLLSKLEVLLSLDPRPSESVQSARDSVREALKDLF